MTQLGSQIGAWAVHSRVSFLRRKHGMNIESQVEREEGVKTVRVSQYRYLPDASGCDHKFVDSNHCLKCGWVPPQ